MEKEKTPRRSTRTARRKPLPVLLAALLAVAVCLVLLAAYTARRLDNPNLSPRTAAEEAMAVSVWRQTRQPGPDDVPGLHAWQWPEPTEALASSGNEIAANLHAVSALLVDAQTGAVLLEKNADAPIPPASMTKLVAMYTAFRAIETGEISFDDLVDLPPQSWAKNIPAGSSLMFLGEGQIVTVRELLLGMAIVSGNDAAIALAYHTAGSVEAFIDRMNTEMERLGLTKTRFVEPSGLSEFNTTTAREFAAFSREYIFRYPDALKAFNSRTRFEYPMPWNLPQGRRESPVVQASTNRLLTTLDGCDGLKTGFIYESGYNLALTAQRASDRFISVTMGGPGNGSYEGNLLRNSDGTSLMEWAFTNFTTIRCSQAQRQAVTVWAGTEDSVYAIPAEPALLTAPRAIAAGTEPVSRILLNKAVRAPVFAGERLGTVEYLIDGTVCHTVPLIADRNSAASGLPRRLVDRVAEAFSELF